jgi:hypothetical protein
MRIKELLAWAASVCLLGGAVWYSSSALILKPSYASEVAEQEVAKLNTRRLRSSTASRSCPLTLWSLSMTQAVMDRAFT